MSAALVDAFVSRWHAWLGLPHKPASWYRERLAEELIEQAEAEGFVARLSETADVHYTITRARSNGHDIAATPRPLLPYLYMVAKFTSRCGFYRAAAWLSGGGAHGRPVLEVVNPSKEAKRRAVALRHGIDPDRFQKVCRILLLVWPLFP
ncbi:hypothetical protein F5X96DRAFT_674678 [Biscogniauxia mediterranea]|nr:hypothetical protein F5X96DRAFT_674678 [Biscogniauxia mediterranea]